jgi:Type II CAAX prenyl endopeptidase Rce1-like
MKTPRHPFDVIVDRSRREAALAVAAAWLAFIAALLVGREVEDAGSFAIAAVSGAALVFLGFAAVSRAGRPRRVPADRARLALLSLAAGTGLGVANLAANKAIAAMDPALRALMVERMATLAPLEGLIASPLIEEIAVRLFLMSAIAWIVFRVTKHATLALAIALVGSALFFALLHLDRPLPDKPALANYYRAALVTKYTLAGLPLGWLFWRWGLPYAILCHIAANAAHLALQDSLL